MYSIQIFVCKCIFKMRKFAESSFNKKQTVQINQLFQPYQWFPDDSPFYIKIYQHKIIPHKIFIRIHRSLHFKSTLSRKFDIQQLSCSKLKFPRNQDSCQKIKYTGNKKFAQKLSTCHQISKLQKCWKMLVKCSKSPAKYDIMFIFISFKTQSTTNNLQRGEALNLHILEKIT